MLVRSTPLCRVTMIVQYVKRTLPRTQVALIALLPRGSPGTAKPYQQSFPRAWDLMNRGYRWGRAGLLCWAGHWAEAVTMLGWPLG